MESQTKICFKCQTLKPLDQFNRMTQAKDGLRPTCKECRNQQRRAKYAMNPEPVRAVVRDWKKKVGSQKRYEITRRHQLKKRYGLSEHEYSQILKQQGGTCAICPAKTGKSHGPLHVDHDHETGQVRGLLCGNCNSMLGHAKDDPDRLVSGVTYLLQFADVLEAV